MTTEKTTPTFWQRVTAALEADSKRPRQESVLDQSGDILGEALTRVFRIISILVISAFIAATMPYFLGTPHGPADLIANIYAQACATEGICDLPTLNTGMAIAIILLSGFLMAIWAAFSHSRYYGIYERFEDVMDVLERLELYTIPESELPEAYKKQHEGD